MLCYWITIHILYFGNNDNNRQLDDLLRRFHTIREQYANFLMTLLLLALEASLVSCLMMPLFLKQDTQCYQGWDSTFLMGHHDCDNNAIRYFVCEVWSDNNISRLYITANYGQLCIDKPDSAHVSGFYNGYHGHKKA